MTATQLKKKKTKDNSNNKKISKAIEGQHGVLDKDSSKELEVQHVCAHMSRKSYFASDLAQSLGRACTEEQSEINLLWKCKSVMTCDG